MKSIIQQDKVCMLCGTANDLQVHHMIHGTSNRKNADKYGLKVWLCGNCHTMSPKSVHRDPALDNQMKQIAQRFFEKSHTRDEFISVFGKSYL